MNIKEAILRYVTPLLPPVVITGKVVKVDEKNYTCDVEVENGPTRYDVRLRAVIDGVQNGLLIVPKVGSQVAVNTLEAKKTMSYVTMVSEVEKVLLISDENGGVPIAQNVAQRLNTIEKDLNNLKTVFTGWVIQGGDGGAALKTALASYMAATITTTKASDLESKTVCHG